MALLTLKQIDNIRKQGFRPQIVGCFINKNKQLLFVYDKKHKIWQLPQGGIENKEKINTAFWREMEEELGRDFIKTCEKDINLIYEDKIAFPISQRGSRELYADDGEKINMLGKKYYFFTAYSNADKIDLSKTEFDDYQWLNAAKSSELAKNIYQKGKLRITNKVINTLIEKNFLK